jgi:hypothetical protein
MMLESQARSGGPVFRRRSFFRYIIRAGTKPNNLCSCGIGAWKRWIPTNGSRVSWARHAAYCEKSHYTRPRQRDGCLQEPFLAA